jgi:hypothetical protein
MAGSGPALGARSGHRYQSESEPLDRCPSRGRGAVSQSPSTAAGPRTVAQVAWPVFVRRNRALERRVCRSPLEAALAAGSKALLILSDGNDTGRWRNRAGCRRPLSINPRDWRPSIRRAGSRLWRNPGAHRGRPAEPLRYWFSFFRRIRRRRGAPTQGRSDPAGVNSARPPAIPRSALTYCSELSTSADRPLSLPDLSIAVMA